MKIRTAVPSDLRAVETLLASASLPRDGVKECLKDFLVADENGEIVGAIGLEPYGDSGLLRSAVIAPAQRKSGIGRQLVAGILGRASELGVRDLYLLTTTAEEYFPRFGFRRIPRDQASEAVKRSAEFTSACPASAALMHLELTPDSR